VTSLSSRAVARRYFGRDGVRGFVGDVITPDLVERLGRAATIWSGRGRVFVGRDTRGSGPELEEAFAAGVVSAGGSVVLAGVLPSPAVALLALDLGVVISASHNPPEFNGVKFFDRDGQKLSDEAEEEIEALLDAPPAGGGELDRIDVATDSYLEHVVERFGSYLSGLRIGVDCANGAYSGLAPSAFEELGAEVVAIGDEPDGTNINLGCGATDLRALQQTVVRHGLDLGVAFDGDGDRMLAVDGEGNAVVGDHEPRLPPADGRAPDPRRHDGRRRPLRARGAPPRGRRPRRRAVRPHRLSPRPRDGRRPLLRAPALPRARRAPAR